MKRSDIALWIIFILHALVILLGNLYLSTDDQATKLNASALPRFWWIALSIFGFVVSLFAIVILVMVLYYSFGDVFGWFAKSEARKKTSDKLINLLEILIIVILARYLLIFLYLSGFIFSLYKFFQNVMLPMLSDGTNWFLSNLFGWIVSGVVGNFFYDLIKKTFQSKDLE